MLTLSTVIEAIKPLDKKAMTQAQVRQDRLTKPQGSLGQLEELSVQLAGIQGKPVPQVKNKAIITMAGDHGVVAEKVGNWPQEVTAQMVGNFLGGGAAINVMARQAGVRLVVVDMGVATPLPNHPDLVCRKVAPGSANMCLGPAMTREQAVQAIETGIHIVTEDLAQSVDIVGVGDMGIGNTTSSAAICSVLTGESVAKATGRGTGLSDEQLTRKVAIIEKALAINRPNPKDPLDVLAKVGGFEIAGLAGVMLGAAAHRIPIVLDGFITGAAALVAVALCPGLKEYLIASHVSAEAGHPLMLKHLGLKPLLNLGMRLGEGTGATLGIFLAEISARILGEMATFGEAGVSEKDEKK